ncbi:hypothetical protein [Pseudomonas gingeri]|uniref:hypothetical protein n=1 Tax=Pseudomonas gingeri TaxID=117681 RepID=UPI0015A162FC|nr:hypothetical protein [Pseudomonas gingeri]NWE46315.1 hypothetical protein [Pseudomonas gingeri]
MKPRLVLVLCSLGLIGGLQSQAAVASCASPEPAALQATWQAFRSATLQGQPEQVERFYRFPLKLLPPMDGSASLNITRPVFLRNYAELFQQGPAGDEVGLLSAMKQSTGEEYITQVKFDDTQCAFIGPTRVEDYNFVYDSKAGWQIDSVYYGSDYDIARSAGLDR